MDKLAKGDVRALFQAMNKEGVSTYNVANTGRSNTALRYDGDKFLEKFDALLDDGLEITGEVYKKFGA